LVVDDYHEVREILRLFLKRIAGCHVVVAKDSERALAMAEKREVDAVISDLNRPGMKGLPFLTAFRNAHPDIPVIIFSGSLDDASRRRALRLGAFACLCKQEQWHGIIRLVDEALDDKQPARRGRPRRFTP
jgi:DNA-binding NtrC family response regulator